MSDELDYQLRKISGYYGVELNSVESFYLHTKSIPYVLTCVELMQSGIEFEPLSRALEKGIDVMVIYNLWFGLSPEQRAQSFNQIYKRGVANV